MATLKGVWILSVSSSPSQTNKHFPSLVFRWKPRKARNPVQMEAFHLADTECIVLFSVCGEPKTERWCHFAVRLQQKCVLWGWHYKSSPGWRRKRLQFPLSVVAAAAEWAAEESSECNGCITALCDALLMQTWSRQVDKPRRDGAV